MSDKPPIRPRNARAKQGANLENQPAVSYDESLLERARTQWQFGDWESLANLDQGILQNNPDRAKLALFVAAGHLQTNNNFEGRQYIRLAQDWGASKKLIAQILIAGVHNSLGGAASFCNQQSSNKHFKSAISIGTPGADVDLIVNAKSCFEAGAIKENVLFDQSANNLSDRIFRNTELRLIIVNGMMRSGSTAVFNIITDLLRTAAIPFVKYYIDDFGSIQKLKDHIIQNPSVCCVLKTHVVSSELSRFAETLPSRYVYTKRNLLEVAASFIRMSRNPLSPFYKNAPLDVAQVIRALDNQVVEYNNTKNLANFLPVDCSDISGVNLLNAVQSIAQHIRCEISFKFAEKIASARCQEESAKYARGISDTSLTSLRHESNTFFHVGHVIEGGTAVSDYLPDDWRKSILEKYSDLVDGNGNLI